MVCSLFACKSRNPTGFDEKTTSTFDQTAAFTCTASMYYHHDGSFPPSAVLCTHWRNLSVSGNLVEIMTAYSFENTALELCLERAA